MVMEQKTAMNCSTFEENLSDFLEKQLNSATYMSAAAHALQCPLCHSLLNDVKDSIAACHSLSEALPALTPLEAKILESTLPEANMVCTEFEEHLTDYLDGFLPAGVFTAGSGTRHSATTAPTFPEWWFVHLRPSSNTSWKNFRFRPGLINEFLRRPLPGAGQLRPSAFADLGAVQAFAYLAYPAARPGGDDAPFAFLFISRASRPTARFRMFTIRACRSPSKAIGRVRSS